ncbi:hypothetical protein MASR2M78_09350 [Treponema sp.]
MFLLVVFFVQMVGAQSFERDAFLDAESRFLSKNYTIALERYNEFLRSWPDSEYVADAQYRRSVTLYRLGRTGEAYDSLARVAARYRSTKYLRYIPFWQGVIEYDRGDYEQALSRFQSLAQNPPDVDTLRQTLIYQGKAATALKKNDEGIAAFERLVELLALAPAHLEEEASALLFLSELYVSSNANTKLITLWERLDPEKLPLVERESISLRVAEAYWALDLLDKAMPLFEKLSSSSRQAIATASLGRLLEQARRSGSEEAVSAIVVKAENVLRSSPGQLAEFWLRVGSGAFQEGRLDLARSYFLRVSALSSAEALNPDVPIYLAEIAFRSGDVPEAYKILSTVKVTEAADLARIKLRLGWYALQLGVWENAKIALDEAISALDTMGDRASGDLARYYLAYALYRGENAEEALIQINSSDLSYPGAKRLRAELLRNAGRPSDALEAFEGLIAENDSLEVRVALMSLLFENGRFDRVVASALDLDKVISAGRALPKELRFAANYSAGISSAAVGAYAQAVKYLDIALKEPFPTEETAAWALYYKGWSLYRLARFQEAKTSFDALLRTYPSHKNAYAAAYLAAWSSASLGDYRSASLSASRAAELSSSPNLGEDSNEALARAAYLEGTLRPFFSDFDGALAALDRAAKAGSTSNPPKQTMYTVRAYFEKGAVLEKAGRIDASDAAFALVTRNYPSDALASEAAYRRGELQYRAKNWKAAVERFAAYRQSYPQGQRFDAALYFGGIALKASGTTDAGILLWERLLAVYPSSLYRFPTSFALARSYREKEDWEAAFRAYTSAIAEFGDRARAAGAADEAETLRYLMAKLPEKAARLHTLLNKENGAATATGRKVAIELARFYINESAQREAALPLLDEVIALADEDPASASEAEALKGDYFAYLESWEKASLAYLSAYKNALKSPSQASSSTGTSIQKNLAPELLFKAARARLRLGKKESAAELVSTLSTSYPSSEWTAQAKRLLEAR